ncbi:alpha/beta fold hydrolase [Corynebacterium nuruki]|uniref:AB hydrolase-1 domain-containing protein n=1 Tax=Corynebacterium nuruki TaxID=1032851 RepID=A0A3D4T018_9CORY|nr:alpha/beta hydrolase [Corynebacterium nuruki]HCT14611.1 hypothetical protein [Corynebacterium nuruki]
MTNSTIDIWISLMNMSPKKSVRISADICAVLDALPQQRVSLLGHSMGGVFMQRVLADTRRPVESVVGISPVGSAGTPLPPD